MQWCFRACACVLGLVFSLLILSLSIPFQGILKNYLVNDESVSKLLDRRWAMSCPDAKISQISISPKTISYRNIPQPCLGEGMIEKINHFSSFYVVRDDLLHPLVNGNKSRKLDALLPVLEDNAVTGVVSRV